MGSDDATTCVIAVFRQAATGQCIVTHIDSASRIESLVDVESRLLLRLLNRSSAARTMAGGAASIAAGAEEREEGEVAGAVGALDEGDEGDEGDGTTIEVSLGGGLDGDEGSTEILAAVLSWLATSHTRQQPGAMAPRSVRPSAAAGPLLTSRTASKRSGICPS